MINRCARLICLLALCAAPAGAQSAADELGAAGWKAVQSGDGDRAASVFRQALSMRPRDPVLNFGAGVAAHMQGRDQQALQLLQKAVQLEPRLTQASVLLGEIAYHAGELDLASRPTKPHWRRRPAIRRRSSSGSTPGAPRHRSTTASRP